MYTPEFSRVDDETELRAMVAAARSGWLVTNTAVHLTGTVSAHQNPDWARTTVTRLTDLHESGRHEPWHVSDAPEEFIDAQLRVIVGIEVSAQSRDLTPPDTPV